MFSFLHIEIRVSHLLIVAALVILGIEFRANIANTVYKSTPAPWESVYVINSANPLQYIILGKTDSLQNCSLAISKMKKAPGVFMCGMGIYNYVGLHPVFRSVVKPITLPINPNTQQPQKPKNPNPEKIV